MSYPSQSAYQPRQQYWIENVLGGGVKVHVPDLVGQAHATGQTRALDQRFGIQQPQQEIIRMPDGSIRMTEGPNVTSPDAFSRAEPRQVPYAPGMPMVGNQPYPGYGPVQPGISSPGFSAVPPVQGYGMTAPGTGQPWQSTAGDFRAGETVQLPNGQLARILAVANPNPIKDAKGEEEEEEEEHRHKMALIALRKKHGFGEAKPGEEEEEEEEEAQRHNQILQNIRARYAQELGPIASDGNTVSAVGAIHKHLPSNTDKVPLKRAVGVDNQPHAFAGGQAKKFPGEAKVDVSSPGDGKPGKKQMGDEEEEEERFKAHAGVTCEKAHGLMPHKAWSAMFAREGTSTVSNMVRGDPLNLPTPAASNARQAAKQVGTTSSEAKSPEEEEEEEEERHRLAQYQIRMRALSAQQSAEGTAQRPSQGMQGNPVNMGLPDNMNPADSAQGKGSPASIAGESVIQQAGQKFHLERNVRDLGSGVPSVTINSLPVEYTQRMQFMMRNFQEIYGNPNPTQGQRGYAAESVAPQPNRALYAQQDPNRYPTASVSGMPANAQTAIVRSAGTINDIVNQSWQAAGAYAGNNQERVRMAWNDVFNRYMQQSGVGAQVRQTLMNSPRTW